MRKLEDMIENLQLKIASEMTSEEVVKLSDLATKYKRALMLLAGALTEADPSLTRVEMVKIAQEALK